MSNVISKIVIDPPMPRPGETVRVEVLDAAGNSFPESTGNVKVNGVEGPVQYLQFPWAGTRNISATATGPDGATEQTFVPIQVIGEPLTFLSHLNFDELAMIQAAQPGANPYAATFTLGWPDDLPPNRARVPKTVPQISENSTRAVRAPTALAKAPTAAGATIRPASGAKPVLRLNLAAVAAQVGDLRLSELAGSLPQREQRYEWDFGDGTTAVTVTPTATHDYFATLDHAAGNGRFVVTCHVVHSGVTVKRTLTLHSAYALSRRTGYIVPHVAADIFAQKFHNKFAASFLVHNPETTPLIIDRMSLAPQKDGDSDPGLYQPNVALERPTTIAPRSSHLFGVNLPCVAGAPNIGELPYDITGFTVTYSGRAGRVPVCFSAVFDIPLDQQARKPEVPAAARVTWPWDQVEKEIQAMTRTRVAPAGDVTLDRKTGTLTAGLGALSSRPLSQKTLQWASQLLAKVYTPVTIPQSNAPAGSPKPALKPFDTIRFDPQFIGSQRGNPPNTMPHNLPAPPPPPPPGSVAAGEVCDPENITDADQEKADAAHLVCQLSGKPEDTKTRRIEARWANARKGDIILSPGGDGLVGGLMLQLDPPQLYGHCGIMTKNFNEITHSTASQERVANHLRGGGSDGLEPDALQYMWPGAITQSVENSIYGEEFPNPDPNPDKEFPDSYSIHPFGASAATVTLFGNMVIIPPMVVKPKPSLESAAVRNTLHAIADDARKAAGRPGVKSKYHYSWYSYTDPTIGLNPPAGPGAGWAEGTRPTCCSSFVWLMAKGRGAHFETTNALAVPADLEPTDKGSGLGQGAQVRPTGSVDGLYTYTAKERLKAGQWLWDYMHNKAFDIAGWFGDALTDAGDDLANQFLNAFANGNCDGKDSTAWKDTKDADAVSPDNILWWDAPDRGGLYGYAVPALYRPPRDEQYTTSVWTKAQGDAKIHGTVFLHDGTLANNATVYVALGGKRGGFWTTTNATGKYVLNPGKGNYTLRAYADYSIQQTGGQPTPRNTIQESAQTPIKLTAADVAHDIHLHLPDSDNRMVWVELNFQGRDDENGAADQFWSNKMDPHVQSLVLKVGPSHNKDSRLLQPYKWGGELRAEFRVTAELAANKGVGITVQGTLYEGTSEETDDFAGSKSITFTVPNWKWAKYELKVENTAEDCPEDRARLTVKVHNWPDNV